MPGLDLALANHLRAANDEVLAALCVAIVAARNLRNINWLIVAHGRKSLVRDPPEIAALMEAYVILLGRLHKL